MNLLRFANIFFAGVNTGIAVSHALQAPQKAKLDPKCFLATQQTLYLKYGSAASVLEPGALGSSLAIAALVQKRKASPVPMLITAACVGAEIAVWATLIDPINRRFAQWNADHIPADWERLRNRWHALHGVRAALNAAAFSTAILSLNER